MAASEERRRAADTAPLRIVQVGLGNFGRSWLNEVLLEEPRIHLAAGVDVDPQAIEWAQAHSPLGAEQCFSSLDAALDSVAVDAVLITAPLSVHVPAAMTALEAGKHVLVEKPFAPSLVEAEAVVDLAAQRGLVLMVSQNYRHFPAVRAAASLVANERFGTLDTVHIGFRRYDNAAPHGERLHYLFAHPMVLDMAIHHFDLMRLVAGRGAEEIYCHAWNPPWSRFEEPAEASAIVRFEGGVTVNYSGSWISPGRPTPWAGEWRMELSHGEITWTSRDGKPLDRADEAIVRPLGGSPERLELPRIEHIDRAGTLHAFVEAVRGETEPETSGRQNLSTLALTLAAVESAQTGHPVSLLKRA
ncbi:MAG TPA: Gfo/Idh/MocA family oxidoreductase [Chloroflexota bacterium]